MGHVSHRASDEDLERMAHQLLWGVGDSPRRLGGATAVAESVEVPAELGGPINTVDFIVPLNEISGLGATVAERLALAGYDNAQALARIADGEVDDLAHEIGTFPGRMHQWVEQARELTIGPGDLTSLID